MQNIPLLPRIILLALALGMASASGAFAQTTAATPTATTPATAVPDKKGKHNAEASLTPAESTQLEKDRNAVLAANPDLKAEADALKDQKKAAKGQGPDAKAAYKQEAKAHEQKVEVAMLKLDPGIAPVLAKLKGAKKAERKANKNGNTPAPVPAAN